MVDQILAQKAKYENQEQQNTIPETLKKPETRNKEMTKRDLLESLKDMEIVKRIKKEVRKIKNFIEEYSNLDEKHDKLVEIFDKAEKEIKELMPAYRVQK
jgi:hypothetical protein